MTLDSPTVLHALQAHVNHPFRKLNTISIIVNDTLATEEISFESLYLNAIRRSRTLIRYRNCPVILLFTEAHEFLEAILACWLAGAIPVSIPVPQRSPQVMRLIQMAKRDAMQVLLTTRKIHERLCKKLPEFDTVLFDFVCWEEVVLNSAESFLQTIELPESDAIALIQYSSGSTSDPKGIAITHGNLAANSEMIRTAFELSASDKSLSWLPHYHDMGLIDGLLQPLYTGFSSVLMPSLLFLYAPHLWFKAIHQFGCTYSGAPNFAFDLCSKKVDPAAVTSFPAERLRLLYNGAEPVKAATLRKFAALFGCIGYTIDKLVPCYGLAEATLAVSVASIETPLILSVDATALSKNKVVPSEDGREIVSCGIPVKDTRVMILDEHGEVSGAAAVGEICVSSPSLCIGYWNNPGATQAMLVTGAQGSNCVYLRTGDMGFVHEGHIFVTGRKKDVLIINGVNYYPQDIEHSAAALLQEHGGRSAAFQLDEGSSSIILVQEVSKGLDRESYQSFAITIRNTVYKEHSITLADIVLAPRSSLLVTTSGKVRRQANKAKYANGEFVNYI